MVRSHPLADEPLGPLVDEYVGRFGTKACCFDDVRPYLEVLTEADAAALRAVLTDAAGGAVQVRTSPASLPRPVRETALS